MTKTKIGDDPLWWITAKASKGAAKKTGKARTKKEPGDEWVRTVVEIRAEHLETLNRMAKRRSVTLRRLLDGLLADILREESIRRGKKRSGKSPD